MTDIDVGVVALAYQLFIFTLIYASLKLNKDAMKYLGMFIFISALFLQQWAFVMWIEMADHAIHADLSTKLGLLYGGYPTFLNIVVMYFVFLVGIEILELYTGYDITAEIKGKIRKKDVHGRIYNHHD